MKHDLMLELVVETWVPAKKCLATEEISPEVRNLLASGQKLVGRDLAWNGFRLRVQRDQRESPVRVLTLIQLPVGNWGHDGLLELSTGEKG